MLRLYSVIKNRWVFRQDVPAGRLYAGFHPLFKNKKAATSGPGIDLFPWSAASLRRYHPDQVQRVTARWRSSQSSTPL